jgi:uncharacterized OB-fold protein
MNDDWTGGSPAIMTSICAQCAHRWYLHRELCPRCAGVDIERHPSAPTGTVVAVTSIAPRLDPAGVGLSVALVDLDDGIRILARCGAELRPGHAVRWLFPDGLTEAGPRVELVSPR